MKKAIIKILALCMCLCMVAGMLAACGNKKDDQNNGGDTGATTTTTADDWANMDDNLFNDGELDWG